MPSSLNGEQLKKPLNALEIYINNSMCSENLKERDYSEDLGGQN
jgi:hypothetical protein